MNEYNQLLEQVTSGTGSVFLIVYYIVWVVAAWKVFAKAGYPGILALIPIVNVIVLVKIAGYSGWLALLYLVPIVNIVLTIVVAVKLGERFGKGAFFSLLWLWVFQFVGFFIIGFGRAQYRSRLV